MFVSFSFSPLLGLNIPNLLMNKFDIIYNVISIPNKFKKGNDSFYSLAIQSGYFSSAEEITNDHIAEILEDHSHFINDWFCWSDDKRTSSGWFFQNSLPDKYVVGFSPWNETKPEVVFTDKYLACATFIKNELEEMRARM